MRAPMLKSLNNLQNIYRYPHFHWTCRFWRKSFFYWKMYTNIYPFYKKIVHIDFSYMVFYVLTYQLNCLLKFYVIIINIIRYVLAICCQFQPVPNILFIFFIDNYKILISSQSSSCIYRKYQLQLNKWGFWNLSSG